jgi:hypothetical protein
MAMLAALAASIPLAFAGEPAAVAKPASVFPEIVIRRSESKHEWAFSIDEGTLTCIGMNGERYVFFAEILTDEEMGEFGNMKLPRSVVVTTNPLTFLATVENRELYLPYDSLETLIRRLAPFETMGRKLCDDAADPLPQDL